MLDNYTEAVKKFDLKLDDLRLIIREKRNGICQLMDDILMGAFQVDVALSKTKGGYVEPLFPPMRHPRFCGDIHNPYSSRYTFSLDYLVHDFGLICRQLESTSKTIFIDMGATLNHYGIKSPYLKLVELYQKFGIKFDHYYAFEAAPEDPNKVYEALPREILTSFHWFNVPVEVNESSKQNPWGAILPQFTENDLVVVKLDVDNAGVELPLLAQLIQNEDNARIVDHFYFEHHVRMKLMLNYWGDRARGTLQDSLVLFTKLRKAGITAHSWV